MKTNVVLRKSCPALLWDTSHTCLRAGCGAQCCVPGRAMQKGGKRVKASQAWL